MTTLAFFDTISCIEIKEIQMEKYNVKLMNNKKGYLNSFKNELGEKFLFLGLKKKETTLNQSSQKKRLKRLMKDTWNLLKRSKVCV